MDWTEEDAVQVRNALIHAVQRLEWQLPAYITGELTAFVSVALEVCGFDVRTEVG